MDSLCENFVSGDSSVKGLIPIKVHFKDKDKDESVIRDLLVNLTEEPIVSWKGKLVSHSSNIVGKGLEETEDFDLLDEDIQKSIFNGLPGYMYKRKILVEIRGMISKVAKLDMNTNNRARGRFTRIAVYVNLDKPLVSQILINGKVQRAKYEFLPTVCFHCGRYGHVKDAYPFRVSEPNSEKNSPPSKMLLKTVSMVIDGTGTGITTKKNKGSRFKALTDMEANVRINSGNRDEVLNNRRKKGKEILPGGNQEVEAFYHNSGCLKSRAYNRGPLNELSFKNLVDPSSFKTNDSRSVVGLMLFRKLASDPRTMYYGASKGLGENNLLMGNKQDKGIGSSSGSVENKDSFLMGRVVKEPGKDHTIAEAPKNNRQVEDGGIASSGSSISTGCSPSKHTTITFKENKDPNAGVLLKGAIVLILGKEKSQSVGRDSSRVLLRDSMDNLAEVISTHSIMDCGSNDSDRMEGR
ncbi:hypothetical protein Gogos_022208 [Gossypium gossypioides]|uniref:CCHC-type domain-containing protein n=1 Tax=Gossypium gossypioides TaxID=34282 RepID=A0A7J9CY65_GOSGO|nr:hypothetical protein [Gossypium gossypioides]